MRQDFNERVGQVAGRDILNINQRPDNEPPDDPDVARGCPQCGTRTWRYTRHCRHCYFDLFEFDKQNALEVQKQRALLMSGSMLVAGLIAIGLGSLIGQGTGVVLIVGGVLAILGAGKLLE